MQSLYFLILFCNRLIVYSRGGGRNNWLYWKILFCSIFTFVGCRHISKTHSLFLCALQQKKGFNKPVSIFGYNYKLILENIPWCKNTLEFILTYFCRVPLQYKDTMNTGWSVTYLRFSLLIVSHIIFSRVFTLRLVIKIFAHFFHFCAFYPTCQHRNISVTLIPIIFHLLH